MSDIEPLTSRYNAITIQQLIDQLQQHPADTPVTATYDNNCAGGIVTSIEPDTYPDHDGNIHNTISVVVE